MPRAAMEETAVGKYGEVQFRQVEIRFAWKCRKSLFDNRFRKQEAEEHS